MDKTVTDTTLVVKTSVDKESPSTTLVVKDEEKRLVYGIVYEPDVVDTQGDYADAEEIEKACHRFMKHYQEIGPRHFETDPDLCLVECYIAPCDFEMAGPYGKQDVMKGTWVIAVKVESEQVWSDIKSGKLTGFSFEGTAREGEHE